MVVGGCDKYASMFISLYLCWRVQDPTPPCLISSKRKQQIISPSLKQQISRGMGRVGNICSKYDFSMVDWHSHSYRSLYFIILQPQDKNMNEIKAITLICRHTFIPSTGKTYLNFSLIYRKNNDPDALYCMHWNSSPSYFTLTVPRVWQFVLPMRREAVINWKTGQHLVRRCLYELNKKPRKASNCLWGFNHVTALMHFKLTSSILWRQGERAETHKADDQLLFYNWTGL